MKKILVIILVVISTAVTAQVTPVIQFGAQTFQVNDTTTSFSTVFGGGIDLLNTATITFNYNIETRQVGILTTVRFNDLNLFRRKTKCYKTF